MRYERGGGKRERDKRIQNRERKCGRERGGKGGWNRGDMNLKKEDRRRVGTEP